MYPKRSVILMKGYPFTRKSELAEVIATSLGCPLLSLEDFLHCLTPPVSPEQEFEAFKVICQIAFHHLDREISKKVVIDSPLSSESHYIHLINCLLKTEKTRVIVIECKPTNTYSWKLKFEEHLALNDEVKWYKQKKWADVEKVIKEHPDYDVTSVSTRRNFVSTLVIDPLLDCSFQVSDGIRSGTRRLVEAVKYLMSRSKLRCPNVVVVYRQWLNSKHLFSSSSPLGEKHCSIHGHDIVPNSPKKNDIVTNTSFPHVLRLLKSTGPTFDLFEDEQGLIQHDETPVDCMACETQVMRSNNIIGDAYFHCRNCSTTLHKECALFSYDDYAGRRTSVIRSGSLFDACEPCTKGRKGFYMGCKTCEFEFRLRNLSLPIAIRHLETKDRFLTALFSNDNEVYRCDACGLIDQSKHMYMCKDRGVTYHYECFTMPRRVKNVHGAHHHHLCLKFESEEAEDYICQECQEYRDPALWYYSCEDCPGYELHPYCVAKLRYLDRNRHRAASMGSSARLGVYMEPIDKEEIEAADKFFYQKIKMEESESISDFYSRVIYLIQWYGDSRKNAEVFDKILWSLPLKFYHIVVAIKRSKEYESMMVDQLMIYLRLYEKRIDNGEDVLIEQVLANLYATQRSCYNYYTGELDDKLIMNAEDVSFDSVVDTDYSKQDSGDNWVKYWGKYWDNYWFNYERGYYSWSQDKCKVQCSICYMFGHHLRRCWSVLDIVTQPLESDKFDQQIS